MAEEFFAVLEIFTGVLTTFWVLKDFLGILIIFLNGEGVCSKQESFSADKNASLVLKKIFLQMKAFGVAEELFCFAEEFYAVLGNFFVVKDFY